MLLSFRFSISRFQWLFAALIFILFCILQSKGIAQENLDLAIQEQEEILAELKAQENKIYQILEDLRLKRIQRDLAQIGLPRHPMDSQLIKHRAMALSYSDRHEQARWVSHVISPEIKRGNLNRTNDFRVDPKVKTGTAITADYWDSGWDRGHMAPSADFRWSRVAISESYLYSNMSPQHPDLNRGQWAALENMLREVVIRENHQLMVVTGPVLEDHLQALGKSGVSIPELYFKVALDLNPKAPKAIGFLFKNKMASYPIQYYAVSVDSIESLTGINFFPGLAEDVIEPLEANFVYDEWLSEAQQGEVLPMAMESLPTGYVNTIVAGEVHLNRDIGVCGKVVSANFSQRSKATFLNLDRKFPNQIFTLTIWKDARPNFAYQPEVFLLDKEVCFEGHVTLSRGTPTMNLTEESQVRLWEEVKRKK